MESQDDIDYTQEQVDAILNSVQVINVREVLRGVIGILLSGHSPHCPRYISHPPSKLEGKICNCHVSMAEKILVNFYEKTAKELNIC